MKFLNRSLTIALIFLASGIGITFASETATSTINLLLDANPDDLNPSDNQPLTLLVGPPGPEGPAGADGVDGTDGVDGVDGASANVAALQPGDANCSNGGTSISVGETAVYACNGAAGANGTNGLNGAPGVAGTNGRDGANGAQGAQGPAGPPGANGTNGTGGGGGTGTGYGAGTLAAGVCDDAVNVELKHSFAGGKFSMNQILMTGMKDACAGTTLKVYFNIRTGALYGDGAGTSYAANDEIVCQRAVSIANWTGATVDARQMTIEGTTTCANATTNTTLVLNTISSRDLATNVGFELG